jgi:NTP pyrophosphatase (non-canonical NTP hydrolase)
MIIQSAESRYVHLQKVHKPWADHNFPNRKWFMPVLGIIEELGELDEAREAFDREKVKDALGDTVIFMLDLCNQRGMDIGGIQKSAMLGTTQESAIGRITGRLAHCALKLEQGIRSVSEVDLRQALVNVLRYCSFVADAYGWDLVAVAEETWEGVSKRDWKKDTQTGGSR